MKGKTICKTLGLVLLALLILVVLYVVYVFASYHRIGNQSLSVMHCSSRDAVPMEDAVETGILIAINEILEDKKKRHIETYLNEEGKSADLIRNS